MSERGTFSGKKKNNINFCCGKTILRSKNAFQACFQILDKKEGFSKFLDHFQIWGYQSNLGTCSWLYLEIPSGLFQIRPIVNSLNFSSTKTFFFSLFNFLPYFEIFGGDFPVIFSIPIAPWRFGFWSVFTKLHFGFLC